jgi:hypothetical protein
MLTIISYIIQASLLAYIATIGFDVVHYTLHRFMRSRVPAFQAIGRLHAVHHQFLGPDLKFDEAFRNKNILWHMIPEYLTQIACLALFLPFLEKGVVALAALFPTWMFLSTLIRRGTDKHHKEVDSISAPRNSFFVSPDYHALHHRYPDRYHSSLVKIFDWFVGTGVQLEGKRVVMTGARGAFGSPLKSLLHESNVAHIECLQFGRDYTYEDYERTACALKNADILVLCHGSKQSPMQANCESFQSLMEIFCEAHKDDFEPPEIWAVGSESECHPAFESVAKRYKESKEAFARIAARYYRDERVIYRHIVPAAFTSPMGPGLMSGKTAARVAMWWIRRGFCYVPVTYTGIAFINYLKFLFLSSRRSPASARP